MQLQSQKILSLVVALAILGATTIILNSVGSSESEILLSVMGQVTIYLLGFQTTSKKEV